MKKFLLSAVALLGFAASASAIDYEPEEGLTTQVNMGMTISSLNNGTGEMRYYTCKPGATQGIKFELMLPNAKGTYLNAGADWMMKGAQMGIEALTPEGKSYDATNKISTHYIQIPVHLGFRYNFAEDFGVYGEVGPYFALGVTGKSKTTLDADGSWVKDYEDSYSIFKKSKDRVNFQRFDAGVGVRLGAEYDNHYSLNLGFDWGLTDMWRDSYRDFKYDMWEANETPDKVNDFKMDKLKNFCFSLTFGYRF